MGQAALIMKTYVEEFTTKNMMQERGETCCFSESPVTCFESTTLDGQVLLVLVMSSASNLLAPFALLCSLRARDRSTLTQLLVPTDDAFEKYGLNENNLEETNRTVLDNVVRYHVVEGMFGTGEMVTQSPLKTLYGSSVTASLDDGTTTLTDSEDREAEVLAGNLTASNGIIHAVGTLMMPFDVNTVRNIPEGGGGGADNVEIAALSAGVAAALILIAAAIAVHKRRQVEAMKPPQVAPEDEGWTGGPAMSRGAPIHPA